VTPAWLLDSTARWSIQNEEYYTLPEIDIENPESTLLDLDDSTFDNELNSEEEEEKVNLDWEEANREVEDFINESGIDDIWETDSDNLVERYKL
jgi:RNA polymerase II subunit A-like phosphatase